MPRQRSTDGTLDDLGVLITSAYGLNRDWVADARCKGAPAVADDGETGPTLWQFDPLQKVRYRVGRKTVTVTGDEAIKAALMICLGCPVQWECSSWAVRARVLAGTFALYIVDLLWLQKQGVERAQEIIDQARFDGVPVQVRVRDIMASDTAA